jgi:hypothetical protein
VRNFRAYPPVNSIGICNRKYIGAVRRTVS